MPPADSDWRTVWITGASSGIGRELARLLDGKVAHIAVSSPETEALNALAAQSTTIRPYPLDVTHGVAVAACVSAIEDAAGPIDLAVLNAGVWTIMDVDQFDIGAIRNGMDVNYFGVMNALAALVPRMIARRRGHIAIVASVAGYRGLPRAIAYGPTKAALINLAETLRSELEPHGIVVSLINPGFVKTPMTAGNPFPMPGLMAADAAARHILEGLKRRRYEIAFPRAFVAVMKLLRLLPNPLFFWFVRRFMMRKGPQEWRKR